MSNWDEATRAHDGDLIRQVLAIITAYYDTWGRWPTVADVQALLRAGR